MATTSNGALRGRPRDPGIDRQILDAARALLTEGGFEALSFEAISQRAGVPRSMIYRRWPTRVHVANEVASGGDVPLPDVIDADGLGAQVLALVRQILDRYADAAIGAAAVGVIAATHGAPALRSELLAAAETAARGSLRAIVTRGKQSGAIRRDADADALFDMIVGTLIYRALFSLEPAPADYAETVSRQIVSGLVP
jgi:AcrR family transcriptional regulator